MNSKAKNTAFVGLLSALALALSFLEGLLPPLPLLPPGAKLGLSNIVVMYAAGSLGLPGTLSIALIKGGFAFLTRGITAGLMSLSGGLFSALIMWFLFRKTPASLTLIGVCGALSHNLAQFLWACVLTSCAAFFYLPYLLLFGLLTGVATGLVLKLTLPALQRLQNRL